MSEQSKTPWTPGPWRLDDISHAHVVDDDYHVIDGGGYDEKADKMAGFSLSGIMTLADARLISKAPEMVSLLEVAACPANCIDGAYHGHDGEPIQCQFCYERNTLLAYIRGEA